MIDQYGVYKNLAEDRLTQLLDIKGTNKTIKDAMIYSIVAGGKRLRPVLNMMANALLDGDIQETLDNACAIEMIHTYSLIHDDLPAMDNDELRRGKPTSHVMFGEAFAILAGDALLNFAFEIMVKNAIKFQDNLHAHLEAMNIIVKNSGVYGMISGQCSDIEHEGQIITEKELNFIHKHKTSAMIEGALLSGIELCLPRDDERNAVAVYGADIGLTFQIIDDILDVTGDTKTLGKTVGKDSAAHKFTYPVLYGVHKSYKIAKEKTEEAVDALKIFGVRAEPLMALARKILDRKS